MGPARIIVSNFTIKNLIGKGGPLHYKIWGYCLPEHLMQFLDMEQCHGMLIRAYGVMFLMYNGGRDHFGKEAGDLRTLLSKEGGRVGSTCSSFTFNIQLRSYLTGPPSYRCNINKQAVNLPSSNSPSHLLC